MRENKLISFIYALVLLFSASSFADFEKLADWRLVGPNPTNPLFFSEDKGFKGTLVHKSEHSLQTIAVFEEQVPSSMSSAAALESWLNVRFLKNKGRLKQVYFFEGKKSAFHLFIYVDQISVLLQRSGNRVFLFSPVSGEGSVEDSKVLRDLIPLLE